MSKASRSIGRTVAVVGYVRVSTAEQADSGAGLAAQRAAIAAECARREWQLTAIHEDAGLSGKALTRRPALAAALETLSRGEASALMVSKLDRLSRSMVDFARLLERSGREGWKLLPLDLGVDLTTPAGELVATILASVAQWERRIISQRTRDALVARRAEGVRLGGPVAVPIDLAALIAARYRAGATMRAIAAELTADGVPTPRGGSEWRPSTLVRILQREGVPTLPRGRRPLNRAA